jgi:hypothetical protein
LRFFLFFSFWFFNSVKLASTPWSRLSPYCCSCDRNLQVCWLMFLTLS